MCGDKELIKNTPCVYFISDEHERCKIGVASDIKSRFNTLQVGSADKLTIKHIEYVSCIDEAYVLEGEYHAKLHSSRVRGEWFDEIAVDKLLSGDEQREPIETFPGFNISDALNMFTILLEGGSIKEMDNKYDRLISEAWKQHDRDTDHAYSHPLDTGHRPFYVPNNLAKTSELCKQIFINEDLASGVSK